MTQEREVVNRSPFEILLSEHATLRTRLRGASEAADSKTAEAQARREVAALCDATKAHMRREEANLFPVGDRLFGLCGAVLVLRRDHAGIEVKLSRPGPISKRHVAGWLETFAVDLQAHLRREERVLFPMMAALMSGKEKESLARQLRRSSLNSGATED